MLGINTLYKDKADTFFNELSDALLSNKKVNNDDFVLFSKIIDLYNFFIEKESCINYRIRHLQLNNYIFTAEVIERNRDFNYFNELFTKAGFTLDETCKTDIKKQWKIENSDKNIFEEKLKNAISFIIDDPKGSEGRILIARLLGKHMTNIPDADVEDYLLTIAEKDPDKIINLYTGDDVNLRYLFVEAKDKYIIYLKNKLYLYGDNIILGATDDAVIAWMKDPKNRKILELIKKDTYPDLYTNDKK